MPHSDPHSMKTLNPVLGRGSVTNQDVPTANTAAEWNTTSPATTRARATSSSPRRPPGRPGSDPGAVVPAAAAAITGPAMLVLLRGLAAVYGGRTSGECPQPAVATSGSHPRRTAAGHKPLPRPAGQHRTSAQRRRLGQAILRDWPGRGGRLGRFPDPPGPYGGAARGRAGLCGLPEDADASRRPALAARGPRWLGGGRRRWSGPR